MNNIEEWKECLGFARYEVSNLGNVRRKNGSKILSAKPGSTGYLEIPISTSDPKQTRTRRSIARFVMYAFHERPFKPGDVVRYRDGDRFNCSYANLYFDTQSNLVKDSWKTRRQEKRKCRK